MTSFKSEKCLILDEYEIQKCLKFLFRNCRYCETDNFFTVVNFVCVDYFYELHLSSLDDIHRASDLS
jgi:hypothetical protein